MKNFSYFTISAIIAICMTACGADENDYKTGDRSSDSTAVDSTNIDSIGNSTAGGMPRDIPNGTGTDSAKKDSTATERKWPSQSQNPM